MTLPKIKVELPTADYYEAEVKCRNSCPVKTDARGYLMATVAGNLFELKQFLIIALFGALAFELSC